MSDSTTLEKALADFLLTELARDGATVDQVELALRRLQRRAIKICLTDIASQITKRASNAKALGVKMDALNKMQARHFDKQSPRALGK